ncbi:hypothetical protein ACH427_16710 [Streptomyces sp. NPDC020379]|uniref:hypothetical protein n=1 Tax=Streptomyces sp. NPDC020379 TaxID=3365071 RepID=UPI0037BD5750
MSDGMTGALRPPRTTWEYAVSAADRLLLWHAENGHQDAGEESLRLQTAVVLAAAIHRWASDAQQDGPAVASAPLTVLAELLREHALQLLQECPAPADCGGEERARLLDSDEAFEHARRTAVATVQHHLDDATGIITIADRRRVFHAATVRAGLGLLADEAEDY